MTEVFSCRLKSTRVPCEETYPVDPRGPMVGPVFSVEHFLHHRFSMVATLKHLNQLYVYVYYKYFLYYKL